MSQMRNSNTLRKAGILMPEKRNERLLILVPILMIALYNLIVFSVIRNYTLFFWANYLFTMFSFLLFTLIVGKFAFPNGIMIKDLFFGIPLLYLSWIYLVAQIAISALMMALPLVPLISLTIFYTILLGLYLIFAISAIYGKKEIYRTERETTEKVLFVRSLSESIERTRMARSDTLVKKRLGELKEAVQYSDPMSHPSLANIENILSVKIDDLVKNVPSGSPEKILPLIEEISRLVAERNAKCKNLK